MKFFYKTFFFFFFICVQFLFLDSILAAKFHRYKNSSNNSVIFDSGKTYKRNIRSFHEKHGKEVGDDVILSGYGPINLILLYKELTFEVCNDCAGTSRVCYESEISSDDYEDVFGLCRQSSSCQFKVKDIGYALFFGGEQIFKYKFTGCLQVKMESLVATRFPSCKPKMDDKYMIKLFVDIDPECSIKVKNAKIYVPPTATKSKSTIKALSTKSKVLPPTKSPSKHPSKSSLFPTWGYIIIIVGIVVLIVILIIGFIAYQLYKTHQPSKRIPPNVDEIKPKPTVSNANVAIVETPTNKNLKLADIAVLHKCYKGWMNILNEPYNVHTSCYKDIQSVLVELEGPILRISRPERLVMKHCTRDDPTFTKDYPPMLSQSSFDITNAKIKLRPKHLARRRWWVRRYPICIVLASPDDKMHIRDDERFAELQTELSEDGTTLINRKAPNQIGSITDDAINVARMSAERDSVATGAYDSDSDHEYELESEGEQVELRASASTDRIAKSSLQKNFPGPSTKPRGRTIYLFARTPREKERWFHVLRKACNKFSKPPHESDALELEKKMFLPEGWTLPENMNKHYFLYVLQEFRYGKHLDKVLTASVDNRTKREHLLANGGIVNMDLGRIGWHRSAHYQTDDLVVIANMFGSRILFDFYHDKDWCELFQGRIQAKLAAIHLPHFIETLELKEFDMGNVVPEITKIYKPVVDDWGMWLDFDLHYEGSLKLVLECYVDLTKLTSKPDPTDTNPATGHENGPHENEKFRDDPQSFKNEDLPCSPEMSPDEDFDAKITDLEKRPKKKKNTAEKVMNVMDKVVHSDIFKKVASLKPVKKTMEKISATPLAITVEVTGMEGTLAINIPPPPSDRLWYAFREPPMITLKSVPQIGDRTIDFEKVSSWIETNIRELLYKLLVMPNMDDVSIVVLEGNELITESLNL